MTSRTTNRGYRIPDPAGVAQSPDGRGQMRALGQDIDADVALLATGYRLLTIVYFTSSGTFTKGNYSGIRAVEIECVGGGGGSGAAAVTIAAQESWGSGGGGGAYGRKFVLASSLGATETVTVGAGGAAGNPGVSGGAGGNGTDTTFGTWCKGQGALGGPATGAIGNSTSGFIAGGAGGSAAGSIGDVVVDGDDAIGQNYFSGNVIRTLNGGARSGGPYGAYCQPNNIGSTQSPARTGRAFGSGAAGAFNTPSQSAQNGAAGSGGLVVVRVYV